MARFLKERNRTHGLAPGTLVHLGKQKMEKAEIRLFDYTSDYLTEKPVESVDECEEYLKTKSVSWINLNGMHDIALIEKIGKIFGLSEFILEDILNTDQQPKFEQADNYDAFILKMFYFDAGKTVIHSEQFR